MSDPVARLNAALEGRYAIERELGEGGMATVYLADDLKHERKVALKVLKPELAAVVGAERFLAEIKVTANLQHPNILPLHDSGETDGFLFYVMPYVQGDTLKDRLDREHQLPVADAVHIATDVAEALDYAHRQGVIHRDIKPANVLLLEGKPVISDFGIALAVGAAGGGRLTETGLSLGTPHYMSPEQATGDQAVGASTDTYALGSVLYEMLVGEPPYPGTTAQAVLGKIIASKPVSAMEERPSIPANVDAAVRKALEKLPADRFTSAQEFARALGDEGFRYGELATAGASAAVGPWKRLTMTLAGTTLLFAVAFGWLLFSPDPPVPVTRLSVDFPGGQDLAGLGMFDISRDGSLFVYMGPGTTGEVGQLWARRSAALEATPIQDTEGATAPAISPDNQKVAYSTGDAIRVVPIQGGIPLTVAPGSDSCCVRWSPDSVWLYFGNRAGGLSRVPAIGGPIDVVTRVDTAGVRLFHTWVDVLPGGEAAVYEAVESGGVNGRLFTVHIESGDVEELRPGRFPRYSQGYLLFTDQDGTTLFAQPFDADELTISGTAMAIVEGLRSPASLWMYYSASQTGSLVYSTSAVEGSPTNLVLVSLDGTPSLLLELDDRAISPRFSPDGLHIAYARTANAGTFGPSDLWVIELSRRSPRPVTYGGNNRFNPIWMLPDGTRLTHADSPNDQNRLLSTLADGSGGSETLLGLGPRRFPTSWSPDGNTLAYYVGPGGTPTITRDIWMLSVDGDGGTPSLEPFVATAFSERGAIFSPSGRWVAYVSDKSGPDEVYAQPFPSRPGAEVTISVGGGTEPVWAPSGSELYYRHDDELLVVSVEETELSLSVGTPRHVLDDLYMRDTAGSVGGVANYDIAPSGEQFVMVEDPSRAGDESVEFYLYLNWAEDLRQRMGN